MRTRRFLSLLFTLALLALVGGVGAVAASASELPAPTSTTPVHVTPEGRPLALVTGVRTGRHPAYDRFVLDLEGIPGYSVRYVSELRSGGTGEVVPVHGAAILGVRLLGAHAHTDDGQATTPREAYPRLPALGHWRLTDDFEGYVEFGLGLADRTGFRVFELRNPDRLVVDVAHPLPAPTSTAPVTLASQAAGTALLTDVRTGRHPGFDRTVFEFAGGTPGVDVRYVPRLYEDGTGNPLPLAGRAVLQVSLNPAAAHDDDGEPMWTGPRSSLPGLPALRQVRFAGDFEGYVTFGLGVDERAGFRVLQLNDPARVVVDVAH